MIEDCGPGGTALAFVVGSLVIYAFGVPWLAFALKVPLLEAVRLGALPFLLADAVKAIIAPDPLPLAWKLANKGEHDSRLGRPQV